MGMTDTWLLRNVLFVSQGLASRVDVYVTKDGVSFLGEDGLAVGIGVTPFGEGGILFPDSGASRRVNEIDASGWMLCPSLSDMHVHFRQPGYEYKETIASGSAAAARAGYGLVAAMPNLNPVPDSPETLAIEQAIIDRDAVISVLPYAAITLGRKGLQLVDMIALREHCVAFSDDGSGVQSDEMMEKAMRMAAFCDCVIAAHCEDNRLLNGGYIHDGEYARAHGHKGICSESEWGQIARDLELAAKTGCRYHVCHISCKESVDIIRQAKKSGVKVTCETGPHYLLLSDKDLQEDGRFKMNPPIRSEADREALLSGLVDGTIDIIATDHAPHSAEEKSRGLAGSAMGIVGLETAFPLLYTHLVEGGILSLERLVEVMAEAPRRIFGLGSALDEGSYALFDLETPYVIDASAFVSKGKATPFDGWTVKGNCLLNVHKNKIVYGVLE